MLFRCCAGCRPGRWCRSPTSSELSFDDAHEPAAIVREMRLGPHDEYWVRIVGWAPKSENRRLFGYAQTLEAADMAVTFIDEPDIVKRSFSRDAARLAGVPSAGDAAAAGGQEARNPV